MVNEGPAIKVLEKYWNLLHDMERELGESMRDYDDAAHFRAGVAADDAEVIMQTAHKVRQQICALTHESFIKLMEREQAFVVQHGEPKTYADNMRAKVFPR